MSSTGEKCGALVGEKSQTVHSANWKLDAMLKREKQMLDVSKKRVEHRITMDKQVVRKRFHMKLHRSKLHHARMTGNKEMLQKLLVQGNFDNNYGAGNDDSSNLISSGDKPLRNIKSANARLIRAKEREMRSTVGSRLGSSCSSPKQRNSFAHEKEKRPSTSRGVDREMSVPLMKPTNDDNRQPSSPVPAKNMHNREASKGYIQKVRPVTAAGTKTTDDQLRGNKNGTHDANSPNLGTSRPKTAIGTMPPTVSPSEGRNSVVTRANATSERVSKEEDRDITSNHGTSSIFNEKPKLTLLDIQMARIRRANFSNKIKAFTESIPSHLKVDSSNVIDLYSAELVDKVNIDQDGSTEQVKSLPEMKTEEEKDEELRSIGNINAPNMTFKELDINYENTKSECIEAIPFLRRSSGLAGILRHRTTSKLSIPSTAWESDEDDDYSD